jgi:hypothetical protein
VVVQFDPAPSTVATPDEPAKLPRKSKVELSLNLPPPEIAKVPVTPASRPILTCELATVSVTLPPPLISSEPMNRDPTVRDGVLSVQPADTVTEPAAVVPIIVLPTVVFSGLEIVTPVESKFKNCAVPVPDTAAATLMLAVSAEVGGPPVGVQLEARPKFVAPDFQK